VCESPAALSQTPRPNSVPLCDSRYLTDGNGVFSPVTGAAVVVGMLALLSV
jgi:hypothetical protein